MRKQFGGNITEKRLNKSGAYKEGKKMYGYKVEKVNSTTGNILGRFMKPEVTSCFHHSDHDKMFKKLGISFLHPSAVEWSGTKECPSDCSDWLLELDDFLKCPAKRNMMKAFGYNITYKQIRNQVRLVMKDEDPNMKIVYNSTSCCSMSRLFKKNGQIEVFNGLKSMTCIPIPIWAKYSEMDIIKRRELGVSRTKKIKPIIDKNGDIDSGEGSGWIWVTVPQPEFLQLGLLFGKITEIEQIGWERNQKIFNRQKELISKVYGDKLLPEPSLNRLTNQQKEVVEERIDSLAKSTN